jgi:hypothetical protein
LELEPAGLIQASRFSVFGNAAVCRRAATRMKTLADFRASFLVACHIPAWEYDML